MVSRKRDVSVPAGDKRAHFEPLCCLLHFDKDTLFSSERELRTSSLHDRGGVGRVWTNVSDVWLFFFSVLYTIKSVNHITIVIVVSCCQGKSTSSRVKLPHFTTCRKKHFNVVTHVGV